MVLIKKKKFQVRNIKRFSIGKFLHARLFFRHTHSNYFISLVDKKYKVIQCITSGLCNIGNSIRKKKAPYIMEQIAKKLKFFCNLYGIKVIELILHSKLINAIYILIQNMKHHHIKICRIKERLLTPHNGIRARKKRRN